MLTGFDKAWVGLDRPGRFTGGVALAEVQVQAFDDLARVGRQQDQIGGEKDRFFDVVSNQEYRFGRAPPDLQQQLLHLFAREGIQRAEGFIHQQHARVGRQGTGQAHTLLLATGELPDAAAVETGQVDQGEHFPGAHFTLRPGYAGQFEAEADVGQHVLPGQQGVVLEHHATFGTGAFDGHAIEGDAPGRGLDETGNQVQQRGLATAGRPESHQQLLGPQVE